MPLCFAVMLFCFCFMTLVRFCVVAFGFLLAFSCIIIVVVVVVVVVMLLLSCCAAINV